MTTTAIIVFAAAVVGAVLWFRSRKDGNAEMPLTVYGVGVVGYDKSVMDRTEAQQIAADLARVRVKVLAKLEHIYGERHECAVDALKLDIHYPKPAAWPEWPARLLVVNSTRQPYRAHFAEEIHNLFRIEMWGYPHRYESVDENDRVRREEAQEFCRGI